MWVQVKMFRWRLGSRTPSCTHGGLQLILKFCSIFKCVCRLIPMKVLDAHTCAHEYRCLWRYQISLCWSFRKLWAAKIGYQEPSGYKRAGELRWTLELTPSTLSSALRFWAISCGNEYFSELEKAKWPLLMEEKQHKVPPNQLTG